MKILFDTNLLLWAAEDSDRLPPRARAYITDRNVIPVFSSASIWEIAIKRGLGRSDFRVEPRMLRRGLLDSGYMELQIGSMHAIEVDGLPLLHTDPFDRVLVAQARVEGILLLTADPLVADYGDPVELV